MNEQIEPLKNRAIQFSQCAMAVKVASQADLERANGLRQAARALIDTIDALFSPMHRKAKESLNEISMEWKSYLKPPQEADIYLKLEMNAYVARVEKERREAEETARIAAEAEAKRKAEEDAKLLAALKAEEEGKKELAEKIIEEAAKTVTPPKPPPPPPPPKPKAEGMSVRHDWKWRAIDEMAVPRPFLMLDSAKITDHVKEHKEKTQIPGIEAYLESGVVTQRWK